MLAATPPRRTTSSSTRKDSETLCNWSGRSCSANRPGKCMRWSVAIDPVTTIFMMTSAEVRAAGRVSLSSPDVQEPPPGWRAAQGRRNLLGRVWWIFAGLRRARTTPGGVAGLSGYNTGIRTNRRLAGSRLAPTRSTRHALVERVTAGARALGVGIVDGEALCVDAVGEVDRRAGE